MLHLRYGGAKPRSGYSRSLLSATAADRPTAWVGQMDGQTIPQAGMFREITRRSVQLPQITDKEEEWYCNRLINEAILSLDSRVKGPVHINIPLDEPLFGFNSPTLPPVRVIRQSSPAYQIAQEERYAERFASYSKRMIIVGQLPPDNGLNELLEKLRDQSDVVVLSEQLSNISAGGTSTFDTVLYAASEKEMEELTPELVITLGGHIVSKRLKQFIRSANIHEQWQISPDGEVIDTFQSVTDIIRSDDKTFLRHLADELNGLESNDGKRSKNFKHLWESACALITEPNVAFSDLYAVGAYLQALPDNASLQLGNSNSLRLAQLFDIHQSIRVFCNRGTNGIEGSLSTSVGYAAASGSLTFLLIGDLSFFYDMNAIWNKYCGSNLRILLNNNGGGEIFGILPGLNKSEVLHEYIAATHSTRAKAWAEQQGFLYLSAHDEEEFNRHLPLLTDEGSEQPVLLEVFTSMDKNASQIRAYYHQQKNSIRQ